MIPVSNDAQAGAAATQTSTSPLSAGGNIEAIVLGANGRELSVQVDHKTLQLQVPSRLLDARTLTLQGVEPSKSEFQVKIVEKDGRALPKAIFASMTSRPSLSQAAPSSIVQTSEIEVAAQPLSADGKVIGSSLILSLRTRPPDTTADTTFESRPPAAQSSEAEPYGLSTKSMVPVRQPMTPTPTVSKQATNFSDDILTHHEASKSMLNQGETPKEGGIKRAAMPSSAGLISVTQDEASQVREARTVPLTTAVSQAVVSPDQGRPTQESKERMEVLGTAALRTNKQSAPNDSGAVVAEEKIRAQLRQSADASISSVNVKQTSTKGTAMLAATTYQSPLGLGATISPEVTPPTPLAGSQVQLADGNQPMDALVVERTNGGKIVLEAEGLFFRIEQSVDLPVGTTLQATVSSSMLMPAANVTVLDDNLPEPLTRLIQLLDEIDKAGRSMMESDQPDRAGQLPKPDQHLAARFLSLMAGIDRKLPLEGQPALDQKSVAGMQQDQIQALVREIGTAASEPLADGWRSLALPFGVDQAQAVMIFFRDHDFDLEEDSEVEQTKQREAQRAVFDVSLSQLGRCQLDVLCQEKNFDLLIRSEKLLPEVVKTNITNLFLSASEIAGKRGDVAFRLGNFFEPERKSISFQDLKT